MTHAELLGLSHKWEDLYNSDAVKMALECYAEDCVVRPMGGGRLSDPSSVQWSGDPSRADSANATVPMRLLSQSRRLN